MDKKRNRKLINWLGLTGIVALLSYAAAVVFSPLAYPGYNWMAQAVSDLSAETAPSRMLWNQLAALYGKCSLVSVTCVSIFISEKKISTKLFRIGVYLFAVMNWISGVGYTMFPLADSGKEIASFQVTIQNPYCRTISAFSAKAAVNASNALMRCFIPVLRKDITSR